MADFSLVMRPPAVVRASIVRAGPAWKRLEIAAPGATIDDLDVGNATFIEIGGDSAKSLTGMLPQSVPVFIVNLGAGTLTVANASDGSEAGNRFANAIGDDLDLEQGGAAMAWYADDHWIAVAFGGTGGGGPVGDQVVDASGNVVIDASGNRVVPNG